MRASVPLRDRRPVHRRPAIVRAMVTATTPRRGAVLACVLLLVTVLVAACGKGDDGQSPKIGQKGGDEAAARTLGFPVFATKNTTRVGGADSVANAAGVAQAVYAGQSSTTRPAAVTLVDRKNWQAGVAAAVFMSTPVRAPILLTDGDELPPATAGALAALRPTGSKAVGGAQVLRIGGAAKAGSFKSTTIGGSSPYALAQQIDRVQSAAAGRSSDRVIVASADSAAYAMPAAAWAAKSGDPILFVARDNIPRETRVALNAHRQPKIYVLGPPDVVSEKVVRDLRRLGTVTRVSGRTAVGNAIAFARFIDGRFGWGVVDPGHGLVFVAERKPLDAAAAAPLSATGKYGPLLLVGPGNEMPAPLIQYLLDIQPGYERDPVRGVYNHAWLIGDESTISVAEQSRIDALMEIVPVTASAPPDRPAS